jgi:hypothetical protein
MKNMFEHIGENHLTAEQASSAYQFFYMVAMTEMTAKVNKEAAAKKAAKEAKKKAYDEKVIAAYESKKAGAVAEEDCASVDETVFEDGEDEDDEEEEEDEGVNEIATKIESIDLSKEVNNAISSTAVKNETSQLVPLVQKLNASVNKFGISVDHDIVEMKEKKPSKKTKK